jgi:hypothetical protein
VRVARFSAWTIRVTVPSRRDRDRPRRELLLTHLDERDVFLDDLDQNADRLDLMEGENPAREMVEVAAGCPADIGAEIEVALCRVAREGRTDE